MTANNLISSDQIEGYPHPKAADTLFGHQFAEQEFINCFKSNKLHHAWLITGAKGIGKATFAWHMAKFLLTQPIPSIEPKGLFGNSYENQNNDLRENFKKAMIARILAESEPRLVVVRKSFDEKRKTFNRISSIA